MGTIKIKTSELTDTALDWAVAKCEGVTIFGAPEYRTEAAEFLIMHTDDPALNYSTNWSQGGPIIERGGIELNIQIPNSHARKWVGMGYSFPRMSGPTPLIAAMRCYVASKMGDEVEIPEELT